MTRNAGKLSPHLCTPAVRRSLAVVIAASASGAAGLEHGKAIPSSTKEHGCDADRDPATIADDGLYTDDVSSAAAADSATAADQDQQQPTAFLTTSEARAPVPAPSTANIADLVPKSAPAAPAAPAPSSGNAPSTPVAGGDSKPSLSAIWTGAKKLGTKLFGQKAVDKVEQRVQGVVEDVEDDPQLKEAADQLSKTSPEKIVTKAKNVAAKVVGQETVNRVEHAVDVVVESDPGLKKAAEQLIKTDPLKLLHAIENEHPGLVKLWQRLQDINPGAALDKIREKYPEFAAAVDKVLDHPRAELKKIAQLHPEILNNAKKALEDPRAALDWLAEHHPNATAGILNATAEILEDPAAALKKYLKKHPTWVKEVEKYAEHPGAALHELNKKHPKLMQELITTILFPTPSPASPPDGTTAPAVADASNPAPTTAAGLGFEAAPVAEANKPNPAPQNTEGTEG
eukprot:CAMPEP_0178998094 /NCGR_PEP_ID=MMETSP0795-20121207/9336_1 /TAXON_ID=88552 /ORGANISM="Amoebophrya sp., Strain Ameob2" /LENGTH=456 /DNA_ID=CAMNT_0020690763 /DNA_START=138 /DNA_END=1508 /DNA_ORIENTATION=+